MFNRFFGKKPHVVEPEPEQVIITDNMNKSQQIAWLVENEWVSSDFDVNKENILIMDDREEILSAIIDDLSTLSINQREFTLSDYNIISVSSKMAGFKVLDILIKASDIEIHYALLDIILGGKKTLQGGKRTMVDGVDIAIHIWEKYNSAEILFFSGCIVEKSADQSHFTSKFMDYTDEDISKYTIPKDITIEEELDKLLVFFNGF